MFFNSISGKVAEVTPNDQTRFHCVLHLTTPIETLQRIEPGALVAVENLQASAKEKRYTILQVINSFPIPGEASKTKKSRTDVTLRCTATPMGLELLDSGKKQPPVIVAADSFPEFDGAAMLLDDETAVSVLHQIAPESRTKENGSRINIGSYAHLPEVTVGLDAASLVRGNIAVTSSRPRARTTITTSLISALLDNPSYPLHVVYCDVNNQGLLSLVHLIQNTDRAGILCLNDKFVPASVFTSLKTPNDRQGHKRAVYDFLDMSILPSVLEHRRHEFTYPISSILRAGKLSIYRANELTVDQFINDIRIDILDGVEADVEEYIGNLMDGIAQTYRGERFGEKNTRDILEMIDEFTQESKSHAARRNIYDLRAEVQSISETYSKDIPAASRKTVHDIVTQLNDDARSSLLVVQGQKTTDILRFIGTLTQTLIEERLKRLKIRVPVLFIFNNIDEYSQRNSGVWRESGGDRFQEILGTLLQNGRRHGLGFCVTLESASALDTTLARRIGSHFIGPIPFQEEPAMLARQLNVSEELLQPAVQFEDGNFLFMSADSPYHRRVPLPVSTQKNVDVLHAFLDDTLVEQERKRREYQAQEEERARRAAIEREERQKREAEDAARREAQAAADAAAAAEAAAQAGSDGDVAATDSSGRKGAKAGKSDRKPREPRKQKAARKRSDDEPEADEGTSEATAGAAENAAASSETLTFEVRIGGYDADDADSFEPAGDEFTDDRPADAESADEPGNSTGEPGAPREGGREGRKRGSRGGRGRRRSSKKKPPQQGA